MSTPPTSFPEPGQDPNWGNQLVNAITDRDAVIRAVAEGRVTPAELQSAINTVDETVSGVASDLTAHVQATQGVHGIADTAGLATTGDVDGISTDLTEHADTTQHVHGIADTAELVTSDGLQGALDGKQDAGDYADAGHDHDDRYVRTVNDTGPDQDGNVAVEGTATVDTSVGTRVFIGDVMVYGDTGWRVLEVPEMTVGTLAIRRTGDVISLQLDNGQFDGSGTVGLPRLPVAFRPANRVRDMWLPGLSGLSDFPVGTINCSAGGYLNLYAYSEGTAAYFSVRYDTSQAWPTSLPGTPA